MQNSPLGTDLCSGCDRDECSDPGNGCAEWRIRFIEWWDANIHRDEHYFTYAHTDEKEE